MNTTTNIYRTLEELPILLTPIQVMDILNVGRNTVYELLRCGAIRSIRIGKQLRIPKEAVIEYISAVN